MNIGISTASLYPLETEKALKIVAQGPASIGEIFFNAECELEDSFINELEKTIKENSFKITAIHPTMSLAESFMLFSDYTRRYEQGISQYKRYSQIAARLGAKYIVMHGGKPNNVMDDNGYFERFSKIACAVKENSAELLQENVAKHRAGNLDMLKRMKSYLGADAAFCLDIKQSIRGGYSPFDALETLGSSIKHLHLSDNTPFDDCMLPTKGNFDFKKFFCLAQAVGFKGDAVIEVYRRAYGEYNEIFESLEALSKINNQT